MSSHVAWYLTQWGILVLLLLHLSDDCDLAFPLPRTFLVWLPCLHFLSGYLLANQSFIKPIQVPNLYMVQEHCTTSALDPWNTHGRRTGLTITSGSSPLTSIHVSCNSHVMKPSLYSWQKKKSWGKSMLAICPSQRVIYSSNTKGAYYWVEMK